MNLKKFISGVSALAIAASAFAAMAVTASAATVTNGDGSTTTTFTADYSTYTSASDISDWTVGSGALSVDEGTGLKLTGGNEATSTYKVISTVEDTFTKTVTGTIKWNTGVSTGRAGGYNYLTVSDSTGNEIFSVRSYGADQKSSIVTGDTETPEYVWSTGNTLYARNANWDVTFTLNMDTHTIVSLAINPNVGSLKPSVANKPFISSAAASVDRVVFGYYKPGRITESSSTIKYVNIESNKPAAGAAEAVKFSYQKDNVEVGSTTKDITADAKKEGDPYTYTVPAYVVFNDVLYKVSGAYSADTTLAAGTTTVPVTVTQESATVFAFAEFDGTAPHTSSNASQFSNGELKSGIAYGKTIGSVAAPEDGIYTVTIHTGANNNASQDKQGGIVIAGTEIEDKVTFTRSGGGSIKTIENVTLKEGETVAITAAEGKSGLDYILVEKTGDYVAPAETTEAGFTFKSTIEKLADQEVTLTITATNGVSEASDTIYITDKIASGNFAGDLMLAVIITDVEAGITITSAKINVE